MTHSSQRLAFTKMQGAGNDYVLVDGFDHPEVVEQGSSISESVSNRRFGIGSDGLIVLGPSAHADVRMSMWNSDGSRGAMCGNGLRMLACFARERRRVAFDEFNVETDCGIQRVVAQRDVGGGWTAARVTLPPVHIEKLPGSVRFGTTTFEYWTIDVGNPHAVILVDVDPESLPLAEIADAVQGQSRFPDGVNVELVRVGGSNSLTQRTRERGSGETHACGSGATASAMLAMELGKASGPTIEVVMRGGSVLVHRLDDRHAELEGPAVTVFHGHIA